MGRAAGRVLWGYSRAEPRADPDRGRRKGGAGWDFGESCWPSSPRVWPADGDLNLGRALSRDLDPPSPEGPVAALLGKFRDCTGGPRL